LRGITIEIITSDHSILASYKCCINNWCIFFSSLWDITSTTNLGENDFVGYWSATYLLRHAQNPYDPELMEITQRTQLQTDLDSTIMAWNPPSLFVFLLPLTRLSFVTAKFVWLIINLAVVMAASLMLTRIYFPANNPRTTLIYLLFVVIFPPVVSGLYMGQVTFLDSICLSLQIPSLALSARKSLSPSQEQMSSMNWTVCFNQMAFLSSARPIMPNGNGWLSNGYIKSCSHKPTRMNTSRIIHTEN